jgi:hypothetical protein
MSAPVTPLRLSTGLTPRLLRVPMWLPAMPT